jgi:hypothetical protein
VQALGEAQETLVAPATQPLGVTQLTLVAPADMVVVWTVQLDPSKRSTTSTLPYWAVPMAMHALAEVQDTPVR